MTGRTRHPLRRSLLALILLPGLLWATADADAQSKPSVKAGNWDIDENGCIVSVSGKSAPIMFLNYKRQNGNILMFLGSVALSDKRIIVADKDHDVVFSFAGGAAISLTMRGRALSDDDLVLAVERRDWTTLLENFATRRSVDVRLNGSSFGTLDLDGGARAIAALRQCKAAYEGGAGVSPSPSPSGPPRTRKADPFAD